MQSKPRVGMSGLGLMGSAIARNLLLKGFPVRVLAHRSREQVDLLIGQGATEAATAAALARDSDVLLTCVTGTAQVRDLLFRDEGVLAGAHPGLIMADITTADPDFASEAHAALAARGAAFVDAPVNRTPKEAEQGRLNVLAGGDAGDVHRLRPVFDAYAETVHYLGPVGSGYRAKLIHNFIAQANGAVLAEAFGTAAKVGLDLGAFADLCRLSGAHSKSFDRWVPFVIDGDDSGQQFALRNAAKDMRSYSQLAAVASSTAVIGEAVRQIYVLAQNLGHGDRYVPHLFDVIGQINGVAVRARPVQPNKEE
jgi:3-hydroxyisobutyrate dehydrogenase-like beta-hydroxyacid dehydrogenase